MNITKFFIGLIEERNEIKRKHKERLLSVYKEENQGLSPNVDHNGRFHAPIDGYVIPEEISKNFDLKGKEDVIWGKGEFLPVFLTAEEMSELKPYDPNDYKNSVKVKCTKKEYEDFVSFYASNKDFDLKTLICDLKSGKEFLVEGVEHQYVYFKTPQFYAKRIQKEIDRKLEESREEERKYKGKLLLNGDVQVVGNIIRTIIKTIDGAIERKCIVELENKSTLYGTLPAKVDDDYRGKISFMAKVSVSSQDDTHGFYSRPKKILLG